MKQTLKDVLPLIFLSFLKTLFILFLVNMN